MTNGLLLLDQCPVQDMTALERISEVFLNREEIERWRLFDQHKK
jgi:hypothetical protein